MNKFEMNMKNTQQKISDLVRDFRSDKNEVASIINEINRRSVYIKTIFSLIDQYLDEYYPKDNESTEMVEDLVENLNKTLKQDLSDMVLDIMDYYSISISPIDEAPVKKFLEDYIQEKCSDDDPDNDTEL